MLTRRSVLAAAGAPAILRGQAKSRPNFLFLISDDHAGYAMGCDGNPDVPTPNLDRLASEGTRFSRAYCNSPVCTPSRQSMLTGLLPHAAGVTRLPTALSPEKPTLSRQLRKAGYQTAVFGKMHWNRRAEAGLHGFDVAMTEQEISEAWRKDVPARPMPAGIRTKPVWRPFKDHARIWLNSEKLPVAAEDSGMRGTYIARRASEYIAQQSGKPFALWVSLQEPHSPYDFPIEDRGRIDPARLTVPRVGPEDAAQIPLIFRDLTDAEKRGIQAAYYTSVSFMDRNMGRVVDALGRAGLAENTLVVYIGDNGYTLGHHGRFEKHCGYEQAVRVPMLIRWPGRVRRGVVSDLAEFVDIAPTVLDLLGAEPLPAIHGRSLRAQLEGRRAEPKPYIFSEYLENEEAYIRTPEWKFIFSTGARRRTDGYETSNPTPGRYRRLFDLKADPGEFTDVSARNPKAVERLETLMLERFRSTHPDREREPARLARPEAIEWYLRPRD